MSPTGSDYWDAVADGWDEAAAALWRAHSDRVNRALAERWMRDVGTRRLLKTDTFDEAVGEGIFPQLRAAGGEVAGIDVALATLVRARARYAELRLAAADVRALPFRDAAFDAVFSPSTLDHFDRLDDVGIALRELHRVLAPGGRLLLTLDNLSNPMVALRSLLPLGPLRRLGLVPYRVGVTCGPRRLAQLAEGAGFCVLELGAVQHSPRLLVCQLNRLLEAAGLRRLAERVSRRLPLLERLEALPTRFTTGHFIALHAVKR